LLTAVTESGVVRVFDVPREKKLSQIEAGQWRDLKFNLDGTQLAAAGYQDEVRIWDLATGEVRFVLEGHEQPAFNLAFSPSGKTLSTASADGTVRLWSLETGKELHQFRSRLGEGAHLRFSPDGRLFAWAQGADVVVWDVAVNRLAFRLVGETAVAEMAFFGDEKKLATWEEYSVRIWDLENGKQLDHLTSEPDGFSRFSLVSVPNGPVLVRGVLDRATERAALRRVGSSEPLHVFSRLDRDLCFSADGKLAAVGSKQVEIRRVAGGKAVWLPVGHRGATSTIEFSPDGKTVATGGEAGDILLWDVSCLSDDGPPRLYDLTEADLKSRWEELTETAEPAEATHLFVGAPRQSIRFLRDRLGEAKSEDPKQVARWVADLDADEFETRDKAKQSLKGIGKIAETRLRRAVKEDSSAELRQRVADLLDLIDHSAPLPPDMRQADRALRILEHLGSPEAHEALEEVARGPAGAWLTEQAEAALGRLKQGKGLAVP
jgi:WD40 repeat protein